MEDEVNILEYWRVIVKRRWVVVGLIIVAVFSALFLSSRQPKLYKATATIMASALAASPLFGSGVVGLRERSLSPILKSTTLAKQVAQNVDLQVFFPKLYSNKKLTTERKLKSAAGRFRGAVQPKLLKMSGVLDISILWPEPENAAKLANCYVEQLGKYLNLRSLNVNFHIIDPAVAPTRHFKPNTKLYMIFGGVVGLFMGIFIAFFLEFLENLPKAD